MIEKVVKKGSLAELQNPKADLEFWLSRTPEERIAAVEHLRWQRHGDPRRLQELCALLNAHNVAYMIVGGYALAYHGSPRYTGDMDIWVRPDADNARRLLAALADFGFASLGLQIEDFSTEDKVVQIGVPPVRIDVLTSITGVSWDEAFPAKVAGTYGGIPVSYISREHFVRNKRAIGRKKDLADIEALGE
ncbi:MAG: hypothetical protein N3D11_12940 [Candidatus Sumerlaeia bacterium]|nr:hypothetical protein [Candidatus Sumerlaeia bacterium]